MINTALANYSERGVDLRRLDQLSKSSEDGIR